jgi:phosphate transport system substrate-binding protein
MRSPISNLQSPISSYCVLRIAYCVLLASGLLSLAACGATPVVTREPVTLTIATTSACDPLMDDLTDAYHAEYPYVSFERMSGTSSTAVEAVLAGEADLAAVTSISTTETIWMTAVAIDNIAVVVHPSNPIKDLTLLQLRDVFHGRASAWSEVGGAPDDITVITRERGSETRTDFENKVLEGRNVTLNAIVAPSAQAVIDTVGAITTSVGYISMGYRPAGVKMIAVEGVLPTPLTAADRSYPINRPFYFVAWQEPEPGPEGYLRDFVSWVLSPDGQTVVGQRYGKVK